MKGIVGCGLVDCPAGYGKCIGTALAFGNIIALGQGRIPGVQVDSNKEDKSICLLL